MPVNDPNVGLALALTFAAGAATAVGACVVFVPRLVKLASRRTLAAALALSAGVMTYVSFVEIMSLSLQKFQTSGYSEQLAYAYATLSFFGGVVFMMLLNFLVTFLLGGHHHHGHGHSHHGADHLHHDGCGGEVGHSACHSGTRQCTQSSIVQDEAGGTTASGGENAITEEVEVGCPCCSDDPIGELERLQRMAEEMDLLEHQHQQPQPQPPTEVKQSQVDKEEEEKQDLDAPFPADRQKSDDDDDLEAGGYDSDAMRTGADDSQHLVGTEDGEAGHDVGPSEREEARLKEQQKLLRMSVNTAVAIALHNFPEGLVTFLSTLADPKVGAVLCVAIAIHNIPEGICVAMPIYYATGNRWKAFGWAVLSGLSEPFAALLGWAVLATLFSDTLYAVMFGIVAGMMVIISIRELLPTAHRYDPEDSVVTYFFILGMTIMALSLVLFLI